MRRRKPWVSKHLRTHDHPAPKSLQTSPGLPVHPVPAPAKEATVVAMEATGKPSPRLAHP